MRWIGIGLVFLALLVGAWLWTASARENAVRTAAVTLVVPSDWELISESFRPAKPLCASGRCPELTRTYRAPYATPADLDHLLRGADWSMAFDAPCTARMTSVQAACSATGTAHGQDASLYVFGDPAAPEDVELTIHVG